MTVVAEFIVNAAESFFSTRMEENEVNNDSLNDFVHNSHSLLLQAYINNDNVLLFNTKIKGEFNKSIVFYKSLPQVLNTEDALNHINFVTLSTDAAESLYQILRQVYNPLLAVEDDLYFSKLQRKLSDLESNLRVLSHGKGVENIKVILNIDDEVDYWKTVGQKRDANKKEREAASSFCVLFEDICEEIRSLQSSPLQEVKDAAENISGILDDIWRYTIMPYPENRMVHIFDVIGHIICKVIQKATSQVDLWRAYDSLKDNEVLILLTEGLNVVKTWISACKSLTETYWPNYALHPWKGKPYVPIFCSNFDSRLTEIHNIRSTYNQLTKLLTANEKAEMNSDQFLEPFKNINIWICNGPNQPWDTAVAKFAAILRPAEARIAEKLKPRMHHNSTKQMLYEFLRYKTLINRPLVKQALSNELELFVNSLLAMLKNIQNDLKSDELDVKMHKPAELSSVVQQVQWAKQSENQVKEIQMCIEQYLSNFESSKTLLNLVPQVLKDLKTMYTQLHEDWARDVQSLVKEEFTVSEDKPVVEFSNETRLMVVRFCPRLVVVEGEARALAALGFAPPPALAADLQRLIAPLKHARALHQVASFHNTLGERMIASTRPMMLQGALELAALVRDQHPLYWREEDALTQYTLKMKTMVLKLEGQNTYLTSQHLLIRGIVEKLMDTELLAKQAEWKRSIKEIRDIIEKVEANGYKNTDMWRSHWDLQLYKALECQYIKTLLSLHVHFPNVRVDLVLRGRRVRTTPALEEVRVQHYSQLRRLVSLPAHFVGLRTSPTDEKSIFASIVDKYSWLGNKGVSQLEATLARLQCACTSWTRRLALACVDVDALCADHLRTPDDFERNLKACKAYGQAVAKLTFEDEKIEWITVGTLTLRREFEAQARTLWRSVAAALSASCRADAATLHAFTAAAVVTLDDRAASHAVTARDLAELSAKQQALQLKMPEMEKNVEDLKRKSHLLRTWGGDAALDDSVRAWGALRERVRAHHDMFEHQAEIVKTNLKGEWDNLQSGIEAWVSRWTQAKARLEHTRDVGYAEMADRCRSVFDAIDQCDKFIADRDQLIEECGKFNMMFEISQIWKEADDLRKDFFNMWGIFKDYDDEFHVLANQDWIIFQKKLHLLDDFVQKWRGLLEPYTTITLYLKQELDKYADLTAALKYLRGSDFTEKHWREVFSLIDIEYVNPEALQLQHLLRAAPNVKKQMKALQKINSSASNEATIRSTLNELEVWYAGARLVIIYYTDKNKKLIPIVKDYKELLTKVEEQQWVVSSLGAEGAGAAWEARLRAARRLLRAAQHAQRRWLYLEPILCHDDGDLGTRFRKVDQAFKQISRILESDPRLSALVQSARLQSMLDAISEQLNACQSSLNQYIDEKRSIFPRLYFLSDDDLLELLGQARAGAEGKEAIMQSHLKKLFPGITGVNLGPGDMSITALCSHGEVFSLDHPVDIDCSVELWLKKLEQEIRSSLQNTTLKCLVSNSFQEQDPFSLPTQILCLTQNIRVTERIEKAILSKELHKLKDSIENEHSYYASAEVEGETEKFKKQAVILQCVYYESLMKDLIKHNVASTSDWHWQKQLRFYLLNSKEIIIKMGLAEIAYSYEYLGVNTGQFVRTETTDESFLILTQSSHLGFVGNPFGPAGTGKTESVKALGALVGRLVLVFNCDEAMDAECMGRLLSGVALCGAWGCFDEFNRLSSDALAAVSHQLAALLQAARAARYDPTVESVVVINGKRVVVSPWCGVAATMNPVGRGYGGRRALPPALQHALRPLALRPPPREVLAARLLAAAAQHVVCCDRLAGDLDAVFTLASTLLSNQRHYDWGLRALKSAVGSCSAALSARGPSDESAQRAVLRRVLRLNNLSKLTLHDAERFENILAMVFAEIPEEEIATDPVYSSLKTSVVELGLVHNGLQIQKCMELYEQLRQRMGVAIVGPPGSGKSTVRKLLKSAVQRSGRSVVEYVISAKAMRRSWLLGCVQESRAWSDGVVSAVALDVAAQPHDVWSWVVCDGDIDPEWVEALNSVLDDNRLLTLPSGWRVQFGPNVNFIFETHSLEYASPATISRMGIILLSNECHCAEEVLESWIQKKEFDNESAKMAVSLLSQIIKKGIQWISAHKGDVIVRNCEISLVKQIIAQFELSLEEANARTPLNADEIVWSSVQLSITGLFKHNAYDSFYEEVEVPLPLLQTGDMEWAEALLLSPRTLARVPSLRARPSALILGPDASAKNLLAEYVLKERNTTVITVNCTPILEPSDIIAELKRKNAVSSAGGAGACASTGTLSAGDAPRTLLLRALHRAPTDQWGSSQIQSFILQLIQQQGFWAREESGPQWYSAGRINVVATASTVLQSVRLSAILYPVILPEPDEEELLELSRYYLSENVGSNISEQDILSLSHNILSFYKEVKETFRSKSHYKWNPSHLKQWCENIKLYSPTNAAEVLTALYSEAKALFGERLITEDEKSQYNLIVQNILPVSNDIYYKPKLRSDGIYLEQIDYKEWYESTEKLINQCLIDDEHIFGDTGIEVCEELSLLCPILAITLNGGVITLVGSAGAGRRAAARLVCAALSATLVLADQQQHFLNMFKNALTSASEGTHTLLVISEAVAAGDWLAYVEAFLKADSAHALPSKIVPANYTQNAQAFITAKHKLGIVVCLDKEESLAGVWDAHPLLRHRLCWLPPWSRATLRTMPALLLQRLSKESSQPMSTEDLQSLPLEGFVSIYESLEMGNTRVPVRYIYFIKTYYNIYNSKKQTLVRRQETLSAGVEALRRARASVASLQEEASEQEAALAEEQAKANQALEQIGATMRANTDKKEEMHNLKQTIEMENEKLQIRKKEIEAELASVEPVIAAARAAVGDIRPEALSEVRSLRAPPDVVRDVLEGVLRLMGIADTSWHSMKSFLSKRGVKEDIRCLDASQISDDAIQSVERLLERRGASFEQAAAKRASAACAPLAAWVRANLAHARALARVRPLQLQQRELHQNLEQASASAAALESGLSSVSARVAALQAQLGGHARHAAALELRVAASARTLSAAANLLNALAHESETWESDLQNISQEILELSQRSLLAAGYLIFLPDLTEPQAREYVAKWCALIEYEDSSFSIINFLTTPEKLLKWEADGLSLDQSAIKNAVFLDQYVEHGCGLTPLVVDGSGEAGPALPTADVLPAHSEHLHTALQCAARLGRTLVISEVERIDEWWWSIVRGGRGVRAVLVCRAPCAAAPPTRARLATLHFTAHHHALVDQLIRYAMQKQNPEMNEKSKEIKITKATLQKQQHELQENLLKDLSSNSDILNDANLLESLNKTQSTSATISSALEETASLERETRVACELYEESAGRCARLVLAARRLAALPTDDVLDVFVAALDNTGKSINNEEIVKYFVRKIIERVLLSLHKKDKYIVVMYLLQSVYDDIVPEKLWQLFVGNFNIMEDKTVLMDVKNKLNWLKGDCLRKITLIKMQDENLFSRLSLENSNMWLEFQNSGELHLVSRLNITSFEKILAVMALRPESSYRAIIAFVDEVLGCGMVAEALSAAARWSRRTRPALLLAPHAADVLAAHARAEGRALTTVRIESGRESWEAALRASAHAWLAVVAGASPLTRDLVTFVTSLSNYPESELGEEFRLWIVAEDREIPPMLANSCVNVVIEPPEGVKRNAVGTLSAWARDSAGSAPANALAPARSSAPATAPARLLARLALLHAVVQERRNYIPLGWSRYYAWEWGDACAALAAVCGARDDVSARALCAALYAARVDADRDRHVLRALLTRCLRDAVPVLDAMSPRAVFNDYISALESLPDIDSPQLLELPANCRVAWENNAADNIITGLQELNSADIVKKGDTTASLKTILSLWKKHMSGSPLLKPNYHIEMRKLGGWWGAVCSAEARDAAATARALHASLGALARADRPPPLLQVPDEWQLLWTGPEVPSAYLEEFCMRARATLNRVQSYDYPDDYIPKEVDLREFLRPQRVLEAARAIAAARYTRPLHALALTATWDCSDNGDSRGIVVRGLNMCGAYWDGGLSAARARDPAHAPAPPLLLRYVPTADGGAGRDVAGGGTMAEVPLYASASREMELTRVRAPLRPQYSTREALLHAPALYVAEITR